MSDVRDTQFAGYAKALWEDISKALDLPDTDEPTTTDAIIDAVHLTIARRIYDFEYYQIEQVYKKAGNGLFPGEIAQYIAMMPDMTELPKETKGN